VAEAKVNVVCMKWGTRYNGPYVNNLYSMVRRHLTSAHRFVCLTDNREGFFDGIESFPLPFADLSDGKIERSWNKVGLFGRNLAALHGPTLFLDLDLIIVRNIDCLFEYKPGEFCIIHDWSRTHEGNSSVFRLEAGKHAQLLDYFLAHPEEVRGNYRTDQAYISAKLLESGELHYWPEGWCCSFKRHCLPKWPKQWFKSAELAGEAKIVVFHGHPKPPEAAKGGRSKLRIIRPVPWIAEHWNSEAGLHADTDNGRLRTAS
jgi:hypothetical protein